MKYAKKLFAVLLSVLLIQALIIAHRVLKTRSMQQVSHMMFKSVQAAAQTRIAKAMRSKWHLPAIIRQSLPLQLPLR